MGRQLLQEGGQAGQEGGASCRVLLADLIWEGGCQGRPQPVGDVLGCLATTPEHPTCLLGPHGLGPGL